MSTPVPQLRCGLIFGLVQIYLFIYLYEAEILGSFWGECYSSFEGKLVEKLTVDMRKKCGFVD